ncbi:hypothetical protein NKH18_05110 [Streptomyces sp. M10(2022)]
MIGSMHLPDSVGMVTGWCLVDLGRPLEAAEELDRQLALVSRTRSAPRCGTAYAGHWPMRRAARSTTPAR